MHSPRPLYDPRQIIPLIDPDLVLERRLGEGGCNAVFPVRKGKEAKQVQFFYSKFQTFTLQLRFKTFI